MGTGATGYPQANIIYKYCRTAVREPAMYLFQYRHQYQYLYRPSVSPVFVRSVFVRSVLAQYSSTLHSVFVRLVDLEQLRVINKLRVRLDGLDC